MAEVLRIVFSDGWNFLGSVVLLSMVCVAFRDGLRIRITVEKEGVAKVQPPLEN